MTSSQTITHDGTFFYAGTINKKLFHIKKYSNFFSYLPGIDILDQPNFLLLVHLRIKQPIMPSYSHDPD